MDVRTRSTTRLVGSTTTVSRHSESSTHITLTLASSLVRIMTKLIAEENANLGPGGSSNTKKGTVDVHRGGEYYSVSF